MGTLLDQRETKPIPHYSMRGYIMRRKWKKANVNSSLFIMLPLIVLISIFSTFPECSGREIRSAGSSRGAIYDSTLLTRNNATENAPQFNWVIERKECDKLDEGCLCLNKQRNVTEIVCRCDNEKQVRKLYAYKKRNCHNTFNFEEKW